MLAAKLREHALVWALRVLLRVCVAACVCVLQCVLLPVCCSVFCSVCCSVLQSQLAVFLSCEVTAGGERETHTLFLAAPLQESGRGVISAHATQQRPALALIQGIIDLRSQFDSTLDLAKFSPQAFATLRRQATLVCARLLACSHPFWRQEAGRKGSHFALCLVIAACNVIEWVCPHV